MESPELSIGLLPVLPGFSDFFGNFFVCHPFKTKCLDMDRVVYKLPTGLKVQMHI